MKKSAFALFLILVLLFSLCACAKSEGNPSSESMLSTDETQLPSTSVENDPETETNPLVQPDTEEATPLFWRVTGNGYDGEFYLLGSIHVSPGTAYPQEIINAYQACEYLAVESDIVALESDLGAAATAMQTLLYTDGTTISDHIDAELYENAKQVLTDLEFYTPMLDYYMPVFWSQLVENLAIMETEFDIENGVDRYFLNAAKEDGTQILEVEDYMDTYYALASLSEATQVLLLREAIDPEYLETYEDSLKELYDAWSTGDAAAVEALLFSAPDSELTEEELACSEEYENMLIHTRNQHMTDVAATYLTEGKNVFYVVGLAHMLGEDGLVNALTNLGYTVTQVTYE